MGQTVTLQDMGPASPGQAEAQGKQHGGADAAIAFAEGNSEPSAPLLGEPIPPPGMGTGMETRLDVLHKG